MPSTELGQVGEDGAIWTQRELDEMLGPVGSLFIPDQGTNQYLFLSSNALLVPLPPGWVMQVAKCLISSCDSRGAE